MRTSKESLAGTAGTNVDVQGDRGCTPQRREPKGRRTAALTSIGVALVLASGACTPGSGSGAPSPGSSGSVSSSAATSTPTSSSTVRSIPAAIRQPSLTKLSKLTRGRLAPDSDRVDLVKPSFSNPTKVINPLFPISNLDAVILGEVGGQPLKIETTLLPETKTVEWNGEQIEALQSQFCAYLSGRITEVAVDLYAQADDGSVWYFGEDVVDYAKGVAAATAGTWRVGFDGPAAMIMPAHPKVGDVYRTENIPGVAFEQVTVDRVGVTVNGPGGPIDGAMVGLELHQDEAALEPKTFAPGHGEWFSGGDHDFEANALSVPADALRGPTPAELKTLLGSAYGVFNAALSGNWNDSVATVNDMTSTWKAFRAKKVPWRLGAQMRDALTALAAEVSTRNRRTAAQAALGVANATLDLKLRYQPPVKINLARFGLWSRQLLADAEAKNAPAVRGDVTTLAWIRDRIAFNRTDGDDLDDRLRYLRSVADAQEFEVAKVQATLLRETLARIEMPS